MSTLFSGSHGNVYMAAGQNEKAAAAFERFTSAPEMWVDLSVIRRWLDRCWNGGPGCTSRRERLTRRLRRSRIVKRWERADPELQPRVQAAKKRIEELLLEKAREPAATG